MPNVKTGRKSKEKEVKKNKNSTFCYTSQLWEFKIYIEKLNIIFVFYYCSCTLPALEF